MRRLFAILVAAIAVVYSGAALYFFQQERWARDPSLVASDDDAVSRLQHPDAVLGVLQERFARQRFGPTEKELVTRALAQAPSFFEAPFCLATYHASRLEEPSTVRAAYEEALDRYPANGRLHASFAMWLFEARRDLSAWRDPSDGELRDPLPLALDHLKRAVELERDLSWRALEVLDSNRVAPDQWASMLPHDALSQRHLMDALFNGGHYEEGLVVVQESVETSDDVDMLRRATVLALRGQRPELALEAGLKWRTIAAATRTPGASPLDPALAVARAYDALGDVQASSATLDDAIVEIEAEFGTSSRVTLEALCAVGGEYLRRGQTVSAEGFYAQAVSRSPSYVPALLGLGRALVLSGDLEGAIQRYEDVLRVEPDNAEARRELRRMLARASRG